MNAPHFSIMVIGINQLVNQTVCKDGKIRMVSTEQYAEGFAFLITGLNGKKYSNNVCYKTVAKAINAAAKLALPEGA